MRRPRFAQVASLAVLISGLIVACGSGSTRIDQGTNGGGEGASILMEGYPLDRSLDGLLGYPKIDAMVLVSGVKVGESRWTTENGKAPAYILEKRAATEQEAATYATVLTSGSAMVDRVFRGDVVVGAEIRFDVIGGESGGVRVVAGDEIAPDLAALASGGQFLVAGEIVDGVMSPYFIYALEPGGALRSLMASASTSAPEFGLAELEVRLVEAAEPPGDDVRPVPSP